ncbi:HipA domain-containing protein [Steroidobacter sp. S1-65]|uniref:HipA domain-containing protein n=1 Tax=Steroidobacter gossypii TaxID=2805490 RepID=A0ABS1WXU6_9GAMM|nr:HipA domain-containing protein [Steroidobacter gossypii]
MPALVELGRLLQITERILRNEETDQDLQLIFAPGSSLGGARPKASAIDQHGHLAIAKCPKEIDEYSIETWEEIAPRLARQAGIATPQHALLRVAGKAVMLSRRFDRRGMLRIPFLSTMALMGASDGERGSYPEIVDALANMARRGERTLMLYIDASSSTYSSRMSTTTCATTACSGTAAPDGHSPPPMTSILSRRT